ncbi:MAG: hypothetical protein JNJ45_00110 [Chthonomonas sp.]|nr:hypothetical protein [Chthonomonas sp.]
MKRLALLALALGILCAGCAPKTEESAAPAAEPAATNMDTGSGGGVAPMGSGAVGGATPMGGTESLGGGSGGGVADAAKGAARRAASGSSSTAPMPDEGN